MKETKQVVLAVLDGWGHRENSKDNAIANASTPFFDMLWNSYPHTLLSASGLAVGLPEGQIGNSEIGHMTIGAGKVMDTDLIRIGKAVRDNGFISNPAFQRLFAHVKKYNSTLHIKGLIGPGGVHSHSEHLYAFLKAAKQAGIEKVAIHAFTDGRDTPPQSAVFHLEELEKNIADIGIGFIATASGRFYAMDRDNNWDRIKKVEDAIFHGLGIMVKGKKPSEIFKELYKKGGLDEHIEPIIFLDDSGKSIKFEKNDGSFFFNFRSDRTKQLSKKIVEKRDSHNVYFVTMTEYDSDFKADVAFPPIAIETTLAAEISRAGFSQAHIAETEKFPHATYFLNGWKKEPHEGEVHILLESRKDVLTHDLAPKMRAPEIADKAIEEINKGTNFVFLNFANADMVGHTANVPAIIEAVEETDKQLGRVVTALLNKGGIAFVTADHGNAEINIDEKGEKHTAHTTSPVPAIVVAPNRLAYKINNDADLKLSDIAPTILKIFGIDKPSSMTGRSLI